jgi:hypothetical protein
LKHGTTQAQRQSGGARPDSCRRALCKCTGSAAERRGACRRLPIARLSVRQAHGREGAVAVFTARRRPRMAPAAHNTAFSTAILHQAARCWTAMHGRCGRAGRCHAHPHTALAHSAPCMRVPYRSSAAASASPLPDARCCALSQPSPLGRPFGTTTLSVAAGSSPRRASERITFRGRSQLMHFPRSCLTPRASSPAE